MVADAFEVRDGKGHLRDAVSLVPSHIESSDFDEFLCNGVGEIIDGIFGIFDLSIFIVGWIEEALTDELRFSLAMRPILVISSCACRRATEGADCLVKSGDLSRNRRADVCAHDDADRLHERHET